MYWVVLAVALTVEAWAGFILFWIPFYSWFRLGFLLYLILPQTQGARVLYQEHVHPFLRENEAAIEEFISSAHDRAKAAGVGYIKQVVEYIKQQLLGLPPKESTPPATPSPYYSYASSLIARFNLPSERPSAPPNGSTSTANDFYGLLAAAVNAATSNTGFGSSSTRDLSNSGTLIPPSVKGDEERMTFIAAQRERLSTLITALDKEATNLQGNPVRARNVPSMFFDGSSEDDPNDRPKSGLSSRKSEGDFEKIDAESGTEDADNKKRRQTSRQTSGGSWMPWSWGAQPAPTSTSGEDTPMREPSQEPSSGKSSGLEY
ncbi:putative Receptor expression-enhancing protein 2 [Glarea lozoyensis 74030]|nr:putative Receptor expression-enhancing protein 2 [Glarea lozoyensis 74030]